MSLIQMIFLIVATVNVGTAYILTFHFPAVLEERIAEKYVLKSDLAKPVDDMNSHKAVARKSFFNSTSGFAADSDEDHCP